MRQRCEFRGLHALVLGIGLLGQALGQAGHALTEFDCVMKPARVARIGSPIAGIVDEVVVRRGDTVAPGDVVARLRSEVEEAGLEVHRARALNSTRVDAQRSRVELTRKQYARAKMLWERKILPTSTYDEIESEHTLAHSELERELHEQRLARLEYERSKLAVERHTIRSPTSGVVIEQALSAGEFVRPDRYIVTIAVLDPLHIDVFLPVRWFHDIKPGIEAVVEPASPVDGRYEAKVSVVDKVFDAASGSFGIRAVLPNANGVLPGGHRCRITFTSDAM